jgi:hypothetical protein
MAGLLRRLVSSNWYISFVLATWIFSPELRRLVDFETSYHAFSPISLFPTISLLPVIVCLGTEWKRLGINFRRVAIFWTIGFLFSFFIGVITLPPASSAYALVEAMTPLLFAVLLSVAGRDDDLKAVYGRVPSVLLWLAFFSSLYGIFQYVSPPPWDVFWAQNSDIEGSQGETVAYGFRIFGTLNSTGPFSACLVLSILMNLPRLRTSRWWSYALLAPQFIALILTLVRLSWITLLLGLALYLLLSPLRGSVLRGLAVLGGTVAVAIALLFALSHGPETAASSFFDRIATFQHLSEDDSASTRVSQTETLFRYTLREPLGQGLGAVGLAAKLSSGGQTIVVDNGYIARFLEMGFFGFPFFLVAVVLSLGVGWNAYRRFARAGDAESADLIAMSLAIQLTFLIGQFGTDYYFGSTAMFFWFAVFLASGFQNPSGARTTVSRRRLGRLQPYRALP